MNIKNTIYNTMFPDIFSKIKRIPSDIREYVAEFKKNHNPDECKAIMIEFAQCQKQLLAIKQKFQNIYQEYESKNKRLPDQFMVMKEDIHVLVPAFLFDKFLPNYLSRMNLLDLKSAVVKYQKILDGLLDYDKHQKIIDQYFLKSI